MASRELNPKQLRFLRAYLLNGGNATQAAIKAGYSKKTAYAQGCRLLKHADVRKAIAGERAKSAKKFDISKERIESELARVGFSDLGRAFSGPRKLLAVTEMDEDTRRALAGVDVVRRPGGDVVEKVKLHDKLKALELLAKMGGHLKEKVEVEGQLNFARLVAEAGTTGASPLPAPAPAEASPSPTSEPAATPETSEGLPPALGSSGAEGD